LIYLDFFSSVSVFHFFPLYIVSHAFVLFHLSTAAAAAANQSV